MGRPRERGEWYVVSWVDGIGDRHHVAVCHGTGYESPPMYVRWHAQAICDEGNRRRVKRKAKRKP